MNTELGNYSVKVHPRKVVSYFQYFGSRHHISFDSDSFQYVTGNSLSYKENFKKKAIPVKLSNASIKKIRTAVDYMVYLSNWKKIYNWKTKSYFKFRLSFFTATLSASQVHSDLVLKRDILQPFLSWLRQAYKVDRYIWRLEKQSNGNTHFHLILDKYIPWWVLREKWNNYQDKLGYIERFFKSNGHTDPNSTDIHSIRKIKDISKYITKYITKNDNFEFLKDNDHGRLWACSESLSNIQGNSIDYDSLVSDELLKVSQYCLDRAYHDTFFSVWYIDIDILRKLKCELLLRSFDDFIDSHFGSN